VIAAQRWVSRCVALGPKPAFLVARDVIWRAYLANDASTRPILEALEKRKRKAKPVMSCKALYVKTWSA
jgi:hypothetical protein